MPYLNHRLISIKKPLCEVPWYTGWYLYLWPATRERTVCPVKQREEELLTGIPSANKNLVLFRRATPISPPQQYLPVQFSERIVAEGKGPCSVIISGEGEPLFVGTRKMRTFAILFLLVLVWLLCPVEEASATRMQFRSNYAPRMCVAGKSSWTSAEGSGPLHIQPCYKGRKSLISQYSPRLVPIQRRY